jgi:iron(III) transport system permease protein
MGRLYLIFCVLFFVAPVLVLLGQSESAQIAEVVQSSNFEKILFVTVVSGFGGSLISLIIGIFFARIFAKYDWKGKRLQRLILILPYLIPNFVLATAYVVGWNPVTGLLNGFIRFPFGIYGLWGMTFLFGVVHAPVAFLMLEEKVRRLDTSMEEAARLSGARTWTVFRKIEWPLLMPTVLSAFGLCATLNISAFAIPSWIGAPDKSYPLTYKVYQSIQLGGPEGMGLASAYSLVLFLLVLPILAMSAVSQKNEKRFAVISGKAARQGNRDWPWKSFLAFQGLYWFSQIFFWILPLGCLFVSTFVPPGCLQQQGLACFSQFSLKTYSYVLFELSETKQAFHGSFLYGTLGAVFISIAAILAVSMVGKYRKTAKVAEWSFATLSATPGSIIALGLIISYSGRFGINLYNTAWIVVVAFILKYLNLAYQPLRTGMMSISPSLIEAARLSGASSRATWTRILLPILRPEVFGGFFLVLIPILGELTMSIFLVSPEFRSIGTVLFDLQDYADQASAAALSIILVVVILLVNETCRAMSGRRLGY